MSTRRISTENLVRVAEAIRQGRDELGLTQKELGERIGKHERTIQNAESGTKPVQVKTQRLIESGLGWDLGAIARMYAGDGDNHVELDYGDEGDNNNDEDVVELHSPELARLLSHPDFTGPKRDAFIAWLEEEHERYAKDAARLYRLGDPGPSTSED